jgi:hypothetical protein
MSRALAVIVFVGLAACAAPVGVKNASLAPDSAAQCAALCGEAGLTLDSIVIMADNVGCVCRPVSSPQGAPGTADQSAPSTRTGAASAGGMAAILMQEEARRQSAAQRSAAQRR